MWKFNGTELMVGLIGLSPIEFVSSQVPHSVEWALSNWNMVPI